MFIAAHPKTLPYLADRFLNENNITYSKIEGSLLSGITAYDINYADAILAKRLEIKYTFLMLFTPQPLIKKIETDQLRVIINNLPVSEDNSSEVFIPAFALSQLRLKDTSLILEKETLRFDLNAKKITYYRDLNIKQLEIRADSSYAKTKLSADKLRVKVSDFLASEKSASIFPIPDFSLAGLRLKETTLRLNQEELNFDLNASKIDYQRDLNIAQLDIRADSSYGKTKLSADKLRVKAEEFLTSQKNVSNFPIPAFSLAELRLKETTLRLEQEELNFDLNASKIGYHRALNVTRFEMRADSSYGKAKIDGSVKSDRLRGRSYLRVDSSLSHYYLEIIQGVPETFVVDLDADLHSVKMQTHFDALSLHEDPNLHLDNTDISVNYSVKDNNFTLDGTYTLSYDRFMADVTQKLLFKPSGAYSSTLKATLGKDPYGLPFKTVTAQAQGDLENLRGHLSAGQFELEVQSQGYKTFRLHSESKDLALSFIPNLPDILKNNVLTIRSDAVLESTPFALKGDFATEGLNCTIDGDFELDMQDQLYQATLHPKSEAEIWKEYPIQTFAPFKFVYYHRDETGILNLDAKILNLTLFKEESELSGWGNVGSSHFNAYGILFDETGTTLSASATVPSLHTLMSELGFKSPEDEVLFDAAVDVNTTVTLSDKVSVKSRINMPWFLLSPDEKTSYKGDSFYLESTLTDQKLSINRYSLNFMNQHIHSERPSLVSFDSNASLIFHEFWIYDNLLLSGAIKPAEMQGDLRIRSEHFSYDSKDGNVSVKADITARLESNGLQNIEGDVTLLEGVITYEPATDYSISDDVIIIQDIKPKGNIKRYVNIHVTSLKPIAYKSADIDIRVTPDIILWQEPDTPMSIFGMVSIEEGTVKGGGKLFEFDKSEVYFNGANPINPNLNLNMHYYTLDNIDIEIFITNTLGSPLVIFSSKPAMSQNDIMSYILFGEPASSAFDSSGEAKNTAAISSMLFATGLKQIFNDTAGINVDTLNILTNEEGTLGYEIGARFSKDIRVVYKNDTISSVILQYSLGRSIRFDIDVHETGQGASILYIKDF